MDTAEALTHELKKAEKRLTESQDELQQAKEVIHDLEIVKIIQEEANDARIRLSILEDEIIENWKHLSNLDFDTRVKSSKAREIDELAELTCTIIRGMLMHTHEVDEDDF